MIGYAPLLGEVKLVDRPSFLSQPKTYGSPGCTAADISRYQYERGAAADQIATQQERLQAAVDFGDQVRINDANVAANKANQDWEAASNALKQCQAPPLATKGPGIGPVIALLAAVAVVGSMLVLPKLIK